MKRQELREEYIGLIDSVKNVRRQKKDLTTTMFLRGVNYGDSNVRLLVIGRAVNGWREDYSWNPKADIDVNKKADEIITQWDKEENTEIIWKIKRYHSDGSLVSPEEMKGLQWVNFMLGAKDRGAKFWGVAKKVAQELLEAKKREEWTRYIAWTNLCKVAPADGGNPNNTLYHAQKRACQEILKKELDIIKPTHILVVAKYYHKGKPADCPQEDGWTRDFFDILQEYCNAEKTKIAYITRPENRSKENSEEISKELEQAFGIKNI